MTTIDCADHASPNDKLTRGEGPQRTYIALFVFDKSTNIVIKGTKWRLVCRLIAVVFYLITGWLKRN